LYWLAGYEINFAPPIFGVDAAESDRVDGVVPPEEELPRVVRHGDALRGDLEVHACWIQLARLRKLQGLVDGPPNSLRTGLQVVSKRR